MDRNIIRALCALALAGALALSLAGCESIKNGVANALGFSSNAQQEEDTTNWAAATADPILLPEGTDATAQWTNVVSNGTLYGVYNGIWTRNTGYFQVSGDSLTITACGTAVERCVSAIRSPCGKRWTAGPSTSTAPPAISPPTAPTTSLPSAVWTRRPSTA